VSGVAGTGITPDVTAIRVGDQMQHLSLRATDVCIRSVECGGKRLRRC
jgi:hypothetical protein